MFNCNESVIYYFLLLTQYFRNFYVTSSFNYLIFLWRGVRVSPKKFREYLNRFGKIYIYGRLLVMIQLEYNIFQRDEFPAPSPAVLSRAFGQYNRIKMEV